MGIFLGKKTGPKNKILVLVDLENLLKQVTSINIRPEQFSITTWFDSVLRRISRDVGNVEATDVFVFAPPHLAQPWAEIFYRLGFQIVLCPIVPTKDGKGIINTTDERLIEFGKAQSRLGYSHLCLASGDKDFVGLVREASRQGLKIIIIIGSWRSAAQELLSLADKKLDGSERMVYLLTAEVQSASA